MRVGIVVGAGFVALAASLDVFTRSYGWPSPGWGLLNALVISAVFEGVMVRGFVCEQHHHRLGGWLLA